MLAQAARGLAAVVATITLVALTSASHLASASTENVGKAACGLSPSACPGSPAASYAACSWRAVFAHPCPTVQEAVEANIRYNRDPKSHPGNYTLFESAPSSCTRGTRHTAPGASPSPADVGQAGEYFTDAFGILYDARDDEASCSVSVCSESQGPSLCDFSTNFCNVYNLVASTTSSLKFEMVSTGPECYHTKRCAEFTTLVTGYEADPTLCTR